MKLTFLQLPPAERAVYFEQAALRRNLSPVILEKDFWVCWLLGVLFASRFAEVLVFKGGTSLAKVFGVIDRFSEDIDLSLAPEFLNLPDAGASRTQANKWMKAAEARCGVAVQTEIAPALEEAVAAVLGTRERPWFEFRTDAGTNSPVLLFHYPSSQPVGFDYLQRSVKLEFGSLTDQRPVGRHAVRPWLADEFPAAFRHAGYEAAWAMLVSWRCLWRGGKRVAADGLLNYVCERRAMILYPEFAQQGWQIGSGPTESCCKTLTQRLKGSGMRWDAENAEAIMALEALRESGLWKTYWQTLLPKTT